MLHETFLFVALLGETVEFYVIVSPMSPEVSPEMETPVGAMVFWTTAIVMSYLE